MSITLNEEIRKWVLSILKDGKNSLYLNEIIRLCIGYSIQYLKTEVTQMIRQKIYNEHGIVGENESEQLAKLAQDCIAEMFEEREGVFYQINEFLEKDGFNVNEAPLVEITSKLHTLVWYASHHRIFELNDINYARLRNSLNNVLRRYAQYKKIDYKNIIYIYSCDKYLIDFDLPIYDVDTLFQMLIHVGKGDLGNPNLMQILFNLVNSQTEFNKVVPYDVLVQSIYNFHFKAPVGAIEDKEEARDWLSYEAEFYEELELLINNSDVFNIIKYQNMNYVYSCLRKYLDFNKVQYPLDLLLTELNNSKFKDVTILFVLEAVFMKINNQVFYNKTLLFKSLNKVLLNFYKKFL